MQILLIRHGEIYANLKPGKSNKVTPKGTSQNKSVGKLLKKLKLKKVICSDYPRALKTAEEILESNPKVDFQTTPLFGEIYSYLIGGKKKPANYKKDVDRANQAWKHIKSLKEDVAVVSHGNLIRYLIAKALGVNPKKLYNLEIDNASITVIEIDNDVYVGTINNVEHIPLKHRSRKTIYVE